MPRKTKTNGARDGLPRFIGCTLSDEEIVTVQSDILDVARMCQYMDDILEKQLKLSVSWDSYNDCVICTVTGPKGEGYETGLALSSRGPDLASALSISAYKFYHKLDSDLTNGSIEQVKRSWS